jgi:hypothetical protein
VHQASGLDGLSFDPFSFQEDGLASSEVDVSLLELAADLGNVSRACQVTGYSRARHLSDDYRLSTTCQIFRNSSR